jgi:hypothetical protein
VRLKGVRTVKEYTVDRDELLTLGGTGVVSTLCFSGGGIYLNRAFDIRKDLEFTRDLPAPLAAKWTERADNAEIFGIILLGIGVVVLLSFGAKLWSIFHSTSHPDAE